MTRHVLGMATSAQCLISAIDLDDDGDDEQIIARINHTRYLDGETLVRAAKIVLTSDGYECISRRCVYLCRHDDIVSLRADACDKFSTTRREEGEGEGGTWAQCKVNAVRCSMPIKRTNLSGASPLMSGKMVKSERKEKKNSKRRKKALLTRDFFSRNLSVNSSRIFSSRKKKQENFKMQPCGCIV